MIPGDPGTPPASRLVAIIGMGGVFPGARDLDSFWHNIVTGHNAVQELPEEWFDSAALYDPDPDAEDASYARVGGIVEDTGFDAKEFRIPPLTARAMDRTHQMALVASIEAMGDAGYLNRPFDRDRAAVIMGHAGNHTEKFWELGRRVQQHLVDAEVRSALAARGIAPDRIEDAVHRTREWLLRRTDPTSEDTLTGALANVAPARVASYFGMRGPCYVVDSACAASLAAIDSAMAGILAGDFDLALTGASQMVPWSLAMVGFSKFRGLSTRGVRPFDAEADGFVPGEGAGVLVLKRLDRAIQDGDRIRAVIRGIGGSSDGREQGIGAPNPKAQTLAMRRALAMAGYGPDTVQLIETHGAGTPVGDPAELEAMAQAYGSSLAFGQRIALSAVKSQIGHLFGAAGVAGVIKVVLGLEHQTLPPTINHRVRTPRADWAQLPFDVVTEAAPWPGNRDELPRRASVSSFGFGGVNYHLCLEDYQPAYHLSGLDKPAPEPGVEPIAVIGMAGTIAPGGDAEQFWKATLENRTAIRPIPENRFNGRPQLFVDPDRSAVDKGYGGLGAFLDQDDFDPRPFRLPPIMGPRLDPQHRLTLTLARQAMIDAGCESRPFDRQRTAVVVGDSGGCQHTLWKSGLRMLARRAEAALASSGALEAAGIGPAERTEVARCIRDGVRGANPEVSEDSILEGTPQIGPARFAKAADLMGPHMVVDAACASVLAAVGVAVEGLRSRRFDLAVCGGTSSEVTAMSCVAFSKASALSANGSRPFSEEADGIVQGEGGAMFVLKRLADALADGDRIRAVIRGIGMSCDGGTKAMAAPDPSGQRLALERSYASAGYGPESVDYVECHATGTTVGDAAELAAIHSVFGANRDRPLAISAVKSQVGHLGGGAGAAGLLRAILALEHGVLPPTAGVGTLHPSLATSGDIHLISSPAAWPLIGTERPRRAGVNAFGFGGTNCHIALEGFDPVYHRRLVEDHESDSELLLVLGGGTLAEALAAGGDLLKFTGRSFRAAVREAAGKGTQQPARIVFGVSSPEELDSRLALVRNAISGGKPLDSLEPRGISIAAPGVAPNGKVGFLFPGQGSQYADLLRELAGEFPVVQETIDEANTTLTPLLGLRYEEIAFRNGNEDAAAVEERLMKSDLVQPVLLVANVAICRLLQDQGLEPDVVAGHSLGEYAALVAVGAMSLAEGIRLVHARGQAMDRLSQSGDPGAMAMLSTDAPAVEAVLPAILGYVAIANRNCATQTIIAGESEAVARAVMLFAQRGVEGRMLRIAGAFHSRLAAALRPDMDTALQGLSLRHAVVPILSSVTGAYYDPAVQAGTVRKTLLDQLDHPVDFVSMVERLYADGVRTFVEVGPKRALSSFVSDILANRPHAALHSVHPKLGELKTFHRLVGGLMARGRTVGTVGTVRTETAAPAPQNVPSSLSSLSSPSPLSSPSVPSSPSSPSSPIVISGVGLGLPGLRFPVFDDGGIDRIFAGETLIDPMSESDQDKIVAQRINRLVKDGDGPPRFERVVDRSGSVKLSGQRGAFDLARDFGISDEAILRSEPTNQLAVAAGLEALRDAGIPLVRQYRETTRQGRIADGWCLPESLQDETAVIFASAFAGYNTLAGEMERFGAHKYGLLAADGLRYRYQERLAAATSAEERVEADRWFAAEQRRLWNGNDPATPYEFDSHFGSRFVCGANALLARLIKAKGPNLEVDAACSSTTVALSLAEDLLRSGKAARVVIIAADDPTSGPIMEWITSGFLAAGASATDANVVDAAMPFDRRRHGMLIGMGAVGLVVEREETVRARGVSSVGQVLTTRVGNSAGHLTRPDTAFIQNEFDAMMRQAERDHGLDRRAIAGKTIYLSHETFTPARGGIAETEIQALRHAFGDAWREITIVNTKAMTGHAQGAGIEDVVALLSLQHRRIPPVINCREPDPELAGMRLSPGGSTDAEYAIRFSAGFGGQVAISLCQRGTRTTSAVVDHPRYAAWLASVSGQPNAEVEIQHRTLRIRDGAATAVPRVAPAPPAPARVVTASRAATPPPPSAPAPAPAKQPEPAVATGETITDAVLAVVSEKTGYERELLELDLDLEADLGIDTIKQAQIIVRLREQFAIPHQEEFRIKDYPTLRHVIGFISQATGGKVAPEPSTPTTPTTPSIPSSPSSPSSPTSPSFDQVKEIVVQVVSEKTGYEPELLELDLNLEADLGIDTIKQAQILVTLRERLKMPVDPELRIQELATLRRIIEYGMEKVDGAVGAAPVRQPMSEPIPAGFPEPARYRRLTPIAAREDLNGHHAPARLPNGARVLMTDDGLGLAPALAHLLGERGAQVIILTPNGLPSNGTSVRQCRLDQPSDVQSAVLSIRQELGGIDALIHLAGLSVPLGLHPAAEEYSSALSGSVKSAFHLVKALHEDLKTGAVIAVTGLGGQFGFQPESTRADAGIVAAGISGGVAGFFKTVARELPDAAVKVLDLEPEEVTNRPEEAARRILDEVDRGTAALEVGYRQGQRFVVRLVESPVDRSGTEVELGPESVVLVVGGGRGVGATIAKELAARYRPIILTVGRSPLPEEAEGLARMTADQRQQWRRDYHRHRREEQPTLKPVDVEREIERLEAGAETWQTLHTIEQAGARADYRACEVRDAREVDALVREIYARFDRLDVVVFGAGIIEDKPIENKAAASFDRVFDVKGLGYYHLWQALRERPPALLVAFSSVAGRFGNRGQADYAAANDLLSRMTGAIRRTTPGLRAVAIDWTAWSEVGLAARSGATDFLAESGLEPLSPSDGARAFIDELRHGRSPSVCIVRRLGALEPETEANGKPNGHGPAPAAGYLDQPVSLTPEVEVSVQGQLDPIRYPWLNDHVIDGNTLLPGVMGIELMAEAAARLFPGWVVTGLDDLEISRAVKFFPDHPVTLTVSGRALPGEDPDERRAALRISSDFESPNGRIRLPDRLHYAATMILRRSLPNPPMIAPPPASCDALVSRDSLYGPIGVLPHGPLFRVLKDLRMSGDGAFGYLWSIDQAALAARSGGSLHTTPLLCETAFQVAGLLALLKLNWPGLPASVKRLRLFGRPQGETLYATSRVADQTGGVPGFDSDVASTDGTVYLRLEGFRIIGLDHRVDPAE